MKKFKKSDIKFISIVFAVMICIYVVTRYLLGGFYTPEWVARNLFVYIFIFIMIMSVKGCRKFVATAITGYLVGITAGEIFGGFESNVGPQYLHWGWLIFIVVFVLFCIAGLLMENKSK